MQVSLEEGRNESGDEGAGKEFSQNEEIAQLAHMEAENDGVWETEQLLLRAAKHNNWSDTKREGYHLTEEQAKQ